MEQKEKDILLNKLLEERDAKVAKEAVRDFLRELHHEVDYLDLAQKKTAFRTFTGELKKNEDFDKMKNYSPIKYGVGINYFELKKKIREIAERHLKK